MKKVMCTICLILLLSVAGCMSTNPNPVVAHQPGDKYKNCACLKMETESIARQIAIRKDIKKAKGLSNLIKLASSYSLIVPWLFVDLTSAEQVEIEALQKRNNVVLAIAAEKNCGF